MLERPFWFRHASVAVSGAVGRILLPGMTWQRVRRIEPWDAIGVVDVHPGRTETRIVQAARVEIDVARVLRLPIADLCPAARAELAMSPARRVIDGGLALHVSE